MSSLRYALGLDIGISSIGWAVIRNDIYGEPEKIERLGVRIFDKAEQPKTGASLAAPRREARSARRVVRRRKHRKDRIKQLIADTGMMTAAQMNALFQSGRFDTSVYELRVDALERELTLEEAVRVLIHFAQRRGYKSNSRSQEAKDEKEAGKVKQAISANKSRMQKHGYRTVGEMLWKDELFHAVNPDGSIVLTVHNSPDEYRVTVERSMLEEELHLIFARQRELGAEWATPDLEERYCTIWGSQRNFDEGPGGNSKYGGNQIKVGKCTFEKIEDRAPKASYTAEYFRLLQTVNNTKLVSNGMPPEFLDEEQRKIFIDAVFASASLTYTQLRKKLKLEDDVFFNGLYYGNKSAIEVEKKKLGLMPFYHQLRIALNKVEKGAIDKLTVEQRDEIARILMFRKSDDNRITELKAAGISDEFINAILPLSTSKAAHLSVTAMRKLIPYLEQGETYDKACVAVYGSHDGKNGQNQRSKKLSLNDAGEITNPVVRRAVSQSIKVINAIVREYGTPEIVRIELAREMGKSKSVRDEITKKQENNAKKNEQAKKRIAEYKDIPTGQDIVKFKLWEEQQGICLYSGVNLDISRLFEAGYVDIDHIIPYSDSFDDSYNNKVLVLAGENRQKGNRIPYAYFGQDAARWNRFETLVETKIRSFKKRKNLLMRKLPEDKEFKNRHLKDTQYLSRVISRLIEDHLEFSETSRYQKKTQTVNGAITAQIRKRLGIEKIRENGDLHHAADAAVIACVSPGMVHKITNYSKLCEMARTKEGYIDYSTGEILSKEEYDARYAPGFPAPWRLFRKELEARLSDSPRSEIDLLKLQTYENDEEILPVFVSRMPNHKVTGAAHEATIRSGKKDGFVVTRTALSALKLDKNGEIVGYYNRESDNLLYDALKARLTAFGGDAKKAFGNPDEPFRKPKHDGTPGPVVKKVKIFKKSTLVEKVGKYIGENGKECYRGVAEHDSDGGMIRLDVFHIDGDGYYYVPLYVSDTLKKELPNRAFTRNKPYQEWKIMKDEDFVFSLYAHDLIRISNAEAIKLKIAPNAKGNPEKLQTDGLYYYRGFDISTGSLTIDLHDRSYWRKSLGGKTLNLIEKYEVDVLGNYHPVKLPEKRMKFRK